MSLFDGWRTRQDSARPFPPTFHPIRKSDVMELNGRFAPEAVIRPTSAFRRKGRADLRNHSAPSPCSLNVYRGVVDVVFSVAIGLVCEGSASVESACERALTHSATGRGTVRRDFHNPFARKIDRATRCTIPDATAWPNLSSDLPLVTLRVD